MYHFLYEGSYNFIDDTVDMNVMNVMNVLPSSIYMFMSINVTFGNIHVHNTIRVCLGILTSQFLVI